MHVSRRSLLAAAAVPLIACSGAAAARARTLYIAPGGEGGGSSWDDAAPLAAVEDLAVEPGGEILIAAERGAYDLERPLEISAGGARDAPVRVRGVNSATAAPMPALIRGTRGDGEMGDEAFRLLRGADHLHFSHFDFRAIGNGCFRVCGPISNLAVEDCAFENVYRFLENGASGGERDASLRDFAVRRCRGSGVERGFLRIRYASRNGVIEDCAARGLANEGGDIPAGCALDDRARDITYRRCVMEGFQQWRAGSYWNGDGFSDESGNSGVRYEQCEARGSTDGGFDCKSRGVVLENCVAEDNKRNFRIWSGRATLAGCTSRNPNFRGREEERASACHIWIRGEDHALVRISDLTIEDRNATAILEFDSDEARVEIAGVTIDSPRRNWGDVEVRMSAGMLIAEPG